MRRETDVAAPVVLWLRDSGWDVYQEVSLGQSAPRADIVAVIRRPSGLALTWIVEVKRSMSLALIAQALSWRHHAMAHLISVVTPSRDTRGTETYFVQQMCRDYGLGWMRVCDTFDQSVSAEQVAVCIAPRLSRVDAPRPILHYCHEGQKQGAEAGIAGGGYWTPFRETCRRVVDFVRQQPGATMREIVDGAGHHYCSDATARARIVHFISTGVIPGIEARRQGNKVRYYERDALQEKKA